jgi:D-tagatose-1,6-bisphosphate aldolase subunit GatZ/KbaZ
MTRRGPLGWKGALKERWNCAGRRKPHTPRCPQLTFAFREAVFALAHIEAAWLSDRKGIRLSALRQSLEAVMRQHPQYWQSHYQGSPERLAWLREFSLRDRIRYYWAYPAVQQALARLIANLSALIPAALLSQHLPEQSRAIETEGLSPEPLALIRHRVGRVLDRYLSACKIA